MNSNEAQCPPACITADWSCCALSWLLPAAALVKVVCKAERFPKHLSMALDSQCLSTLWLNAMQGLIKRTIPVAGHRLSHASSSHTRCSFQKTRHRMRCLQWTVQAWNCLVTCMSEGIAPRSPIPGTIMACCPEKKQLTAVRCSAKTGMCISSFWWGLHNHGDRSLHLQVCIFVLTMQNGGSSRSRKGVLLCRRHSLSQSKHRPNGRDTDKFETTMIKVCDHCV